MNSLRRSLVLAVVVIRILAAAYILFNPLWGTVLTFFFDWLDAYLLIHHAGFSRREYHFLDKNLDWVGHLAMFVSGVSYGWGGLLALLLVFRLIGQAIFLKTRAVIAFVLFPNLFEAAYVWLVAARQIPAVARLESGSFLWGLFLVLLLKELQEISLHLLWPIYLRQHLARTGYPRLLRRLGFRNIGL